MQNLLVTLQIGSETLQQIRTPEGVDICIYNGDQRPVVEQTDNLADFARNLNIEVDIKGIRYRAFQWIADKRLSVQNFADNCGVEFKQMVDFLWNQGGLTSSQFDKLEEVLKR